MRRADNPRRPAFTLVELLVSLALIIFIMAILSEAFGAASKTFRDLKAIGDMNRRLQVATILLRRDLASDHFDGRKRLSDPNFWADGPPREGYFRIYQDADPTDEGADLDNIHSYLSAHQILQFTAKYRGSRKGDFLTAIVPTQVPAPLAPTSIGSDARYEDNSFAGSGANPHFLYRYQWVEIAYFLRPAPPTGTVDTANGQTLYSLYRRHWLATPDNNSLSPPVPVTNPNPPPAPAQSIADYLQVSCMVDPAGSGNLYFNSPIDLTMPARRMGMTTAGLPSKPFNTGSTNLSVPTLTEDGVTYNPSPKLDGSDLLLADVISFDVRVLLNGGTDFVSLNDPTVQAYATAGHPNFNPGTGTTGRYLFDTWSSNVDDMSQTNPAVYDYSNWAPPASGTPTATTIPTYRNSSGGLIGIRAIQITIRIWDFRTEQTRQVTVVQDL